MRVRFVGEASYDVGNEHTAGVVPVLTRRVLQERGLSVVLEPEAAVLARLHGKGYSKKVQWSIERANDEGCDAVVIVVDNDRQPHGQRLRALREGIELARKRVPIPALAGVAIETLEAWLLADERALKEALDLPEAPARGPDPETLDGKEGTDEHPKTALKKHFALDPQERDYAAKTVAVAEELDLSELEQRCPAGFGAFAKEVRRVLGSGLA